MQILTLNTNKKNIGYDRWQKGILYIYIYICVYCAKTKKEKENKQRMTFAEGSTRRDNGSWQRNRGHVAVAMGPKSIGFMGRNSLLYTAGQPEPFFIFTHFFSWNFKLINNNNKKVYKRTNNFRKQN